MPRKNAAETSEGWMRRIGSKEALQERQMKRADGKLNPVLKGIKGLANLVRAMLKREGCSAHAFTCQCDDCVPPWLKDDMKRWPVVTKGMYEARIVRNPVTVLPFKSTEPKKPRKNWERRGNSTN